MNPVIGILIVAFIWAGLFISPAATYYGWVGVLIALPILGITTLFVVFWWKVITRWIKQI